MKYFAYSKKTGRVVDRYNSWNVFKIIKYLLSPSIIHEKDQRLEVLDLDESKPTMSQWPLNITRIPHAHRYSKGRGVRVGIFDSGLDYTHKEFNPPDYQQVNQNLNFSDGENARLRRPLLEEILRGEHPIVRYGYDFTEPGTGVSGGEDFFDEFRHGTSVTSILAAQGREIVGVAPESEIVVYKVINENGWGMFYTVANNLINALYDGCDIVSFSLAFPYDSKSFGDLVGKLNRAGMLIVAAVGNNHRNVKLYPSASPGVIAVSGCNGRGELWVSSQRKGSNWGNHVQFSTPAAAQPVCKRIMSRYTINEGTSLAAPHMAGIFALVLSILKERAGQQNRVIEDVNRDGEIDILDIVAAARRVGTRSLGLDVTGDRKVDEGDLNQIGKVMGEVKKRVYLRDLAVKIVIESCGRSGKKDIYLGYGVPDAEKACKLALQVPLHSP